MQRSDSSRHLYVHIQQQEHHNKMQSMPEGQQQRHQSDLTK